VFIADVKSNTNFQIQYSYCQKLFIIKYTHDFKRLSLSLNNIIIKDIYKVQDRLRGHKCIKCASQFWIWRIQSHVAKMTVTLLNY